MYLGKINQIMLYAALMTISCLGLVLAVEEYFESHSALSFRATDESLRGRRVVALFERVPMLPDAMVYNYHMNRIVLLYLKGYVRGRLYPCRAVVIHQGLIEESVSSEELDLSILSKYISLK